MAKLNTFGTTGLAGDGKSNRAWQQRQSAECSRQAEGIRSRTYYAHQGGDNSLVRAGRKPGSRK